MPEQTQEELQTEIGRAREDLASTLGEVVNERLPLRKQVARHTAAYTVAVSGISLAVGFFLGRMVARRGIEQPHFLLRI